MPEIGQECRCPTGPIQVGSAEFPAHKQSGLACAEAEALVGVPMVDGCREQDPRTVDNKQQSRYACRQCHEWQEAPMAKQPIAL